MQISCRLTEGLPSRLISVSCYLCSLACITSCRYVKISRSHSHLLHVLFCPFREGAEFSTGYTYSDYCDNHSRICGIGPAFSGAVCSCTTKAQVYSSQQVRHINFTAVSHQQILHHKKLVGYVADNKYSTSTQLCSFSVG